MEIAEEFCGMEAFEKVLDGAHERSMKGIMDMVVNHTSDEHEWFQKSRKRIDPYIDYYIWRPAKADGKLPNNWDSLFEEKAWQWDDSANGGFTTGTPWFYVNDNYKEINVAAQEKDENSVLNFYRRAIKLRKELSCVRHGKSKADPWKL